MGQARSKQKICDRANVPHEIMRDPVNKDKKQDIDYCYYKSQSY